MMSGTIHDLPEGDRPREKLATLGAAALSDSELIAILLRTGVPGANAVEVARQLISRYGSLGGLARASVKELAATKGVGPAKAVQLAAAFGLGARLAREKFSRGERLTKPELIYEMLGPEMRTLARECFRVVLLDARYRLLEVAEVSTGSADQTVAHPRDVFRPALLHSAFAVIVVHNHPSGDPTPSEADRLLTLSLKDAANLLRIPLVDHIVIGAPGQGGKPGYASFRELGVL